MDSKEAFEKIVSTYIEYCRTKDKNVSKLGKSVVDWLRVTELNQVECAEKLRSIGSIFLIAKDVENHLKQFLEWKGNDVQYLIFILSDHESDPAKFKIKYDKLRIGKQWGIDLYGETAKLINDTKLLNAGIPRIDPRIGLGTITIKY